MARGDRSDRDAPEPLARLLARSEAVERELERARERLADIAERFDAERPLTDGPADDRPTDDGPSEDPPLDQPPSDDRPSDEQPPVDDLPTDEPPADDRPADRLIVVPEPVERHEPSRDHDITVLQEAARRRLSDER